MTSTQAGPAGPGAGSTDLLHAAAQALLAAQDAQGRWRGDDPPDATLPAEAMLVREYLGTGRPAITAAAAMRLRAAQRPDGWWAGAAAPDGGGDLTASALSYLALRLAGDSADAYHLAIAAGWIRDAGGLEAISTRGTAWLAAFGLTGWARVPVPVLDVSRLAAVTFSVLASARPARPAALTLTELQSGPGPLTAPADRRLAGPALTARRAVARLGGQWLIDWQQRDGTPAAGRPAWPLMLIALAELGYPLHHPVLSAGLTWLDTVTGAGRAAGDTALVTAGLVPPVAATALAILALTGTGLPAASPALAAASRWLLAQRIDGPAERVLRPPGMTIHGPAKASLAKAAAAPSGWSFGSDGYPVPADTAEVLLALGGVDLAADRRAVPATAGWLAALPEHDGSWSHSVPVTAQVVRALCAHGRREEAAVRRGVVWLLRAQRADGSWVAGGEQLQATALALTALAAAGVRPGKPSMRAATGWLVRQSAGDGWAADPPAGRTRTRDTPDVAATARGLTALLAAGDQPGASGAQAAAVAARAAGWLAAAQRPGSQSAANVLALAAASRFGPLGTSATS